MTETAHDRQFDDLAPPAGGTAPLFELSFGRLAAVFAVLAVAAVGWAYLAVMTTAMEPGPLFDAICRPAFGLEQTFGNQALVLSMWCAMALAMMLPTAGPVILTYAEIADTAARKGERVVSPVILCAGYVAVWFGFAVVATVLQVLLTRMALLDPAMRSASLMFSGAIFIAAGLYQFSGFKHACLRRCQRPFPFLFANWTDAAAGVFRLGLRHGRDCLGCCWALMLIMFAVGVMNVAWMAALGLVMGLEKVAPSQWFSRAVGVTAIAIGIAFAGAGSMT